MLNFLMLNYNIAMCKNDIYTIEINSKEYSGANSKFYLDIQGRFPELVGKTVIVKPIFSPTKHHG